MNEVIRTFICIDLPSNLKSRLENLTVELQKSSKSKIGWVKPNNMHLTLRFLGDIAKEQISIVQGCVERSCEGISSFTVTASELGVFPNLRHPRVFWVGIKDFTAYLLPLQKKLEQELVKAGFDKADKAFSPHLTIGRVREGNPQEVITKLGQIKFTPENILVKELIVMQSELKTGGSVYTKLAIVPLHS